MTPARPPDLETDILVVGAGPTGLALARGLLDVISGAAHGSCAGGIRLGQMQAGQMRNEQAYA